MKGAIRYTVKVTATIERVEKVGKEWAVLEKKADGSEPRGYTPEVEKTVKRDIEVYSQTVDDLDMAALVKVVNKVT